MSGIGEENGRRARVAGLSSSQRALLQAVFLSGADQGLERPAQLVSARKLGEPFEAPLSPAQERLWVLDQLDPGSVAYNMQFGVRLSGPLDCQAVEGAVNGILQRHEVLRTTLPRRAGGPVQIIHPFQPRPLELVQVRRCGEDSSAICKRYLRDESTRRFDLAKGPLLRIQLVRLAKDDHLLVLCVHHIVFDGWSGGIWMREFFRDYNQLSRDGNTVLPNLRFQYADYAVWQRQLMRSQSVRSGLAYWKKRLEGVRPLTFPGKSTNAEADATKAGSYAISIDRSLADQLVTLSREFEATLFMTLMAAFKVALHWHAGQDDVVVATPSANRPTKEMESIIGFFVNMLVLRTDLSGDPTFLELLKRERSVTLGGFDHQHVPFDMVSRQMELTGDPWRNSLLRVTLALQNAPSVKMDAASLGVEPVWSEEPVARFDLALSITESASGLQAVFEYRSNLFEKEAIARIAGSWQELLRQIPKNLRRRLSELRKLAGGVGRDRLMGGSERVDLLHSGVEAIKPVEKSLAIQRIEERLQNIWRRLLGTTEIDFEASFFELGGTSVQLLLMMYEIDAEFGVSLPPAELFRRLTIESLVERLHASMAACGTGVAGLVHLNAFDSKKQVVFVAHDGTGELSGYRWLGECLEGRINLVGVQSILTKKVFPQEFNVSLAASKYRARIQAFQPAGPYSLVGWSAGATLAYEIASQLERDGESVRVLSLLDPPWPGEGRTAQSFSTMDEKALQSRWCESRADNDEEVEVAELWERFVERLEISPAEELERVKMNVLRDIDAAAGLQALTLREIIAHLNIVRSINQGMTNYSPRDPISGCVYLYVPGQAREESVQNWRRLCGSRMVVQAVEGNHLTMVQPPFVQDLAVLFEAAHGPAKALASNVSVIEGRAGCFVIEG